MSEQSTKSVSGQGMQDGLDNLRTLADEITREREAVLAAAIKAERLRVLAAIEHCLHNPIAYPENMAGLIRRLRSAP